MLGFVIGIICAAFAVTILVVFHKKQKKEETKQASFGKYFEE